ncbi:hypothetical protein [Rhodococcus sp. JVH1]|uniref:hypothetical protein n=1 Tax=Rhodococcus sp. JVH1 TaxID=745408 RepID=UPI000272222F|nr:hypothetical protein [Rhodococcus sp. JVH1]EJI96898.1 hypothetical protein JVH1_5620 [Rhodococcus sp. JVH1]
MGDTGAWILNGATGMVLPRFGVFHAQQLFELVECDPKRFDLSAGKYRVSTRMYAYNLVADEGWKMQWHWHPDGNSPEHRPHIHPTVNPKAHMPSGRHTLEDIVEGCIQLGAQPGCDDWAKRLLETSGPHKLYRTWVNDPNENAPASSSTAE